MSGGRWCGAVLAGGASRRMGADKALLALDGHPMARRAAMALRAAGASTVVAIGGDLGALVAAGLSAHPDDHPGQGPLGGIVTALRAARDPVLMVLACDLVRPDPAAIRAVVAALATTPGALAAVPELAGRLEPLHGAYSVAALGPLAAAFASGERSVHRAVRALPFVSVAGIDAASLADADTPGDLGRTGGSLPGVPGADVPEIGIEELAERHQLGIVLVDVRQPDEYDEFHVPGAVLIPLAEVPERLAEVPSDGVVHVICRSGGRSRTAVELLRHRGYDAVNVAGGSLAWYESGRPVATGPQPA